MVLTETVAHFYHANYPYLKSLCQDLSEFDVSNLARTSDHHLQLAAITLRELKKIRIWRIRNITEHAKNVSDGQKSCGDKDLIFRCRKFFVELKWSKKIINKKKRILDKSIKSLLGSGLGGFLGGSLLGGLASLLGGGLLGNLLGGNLLGGGGLGGSGLGGNGLGYK